MVKSYLTKLAFNDQSKHTFLSGSFGYEDFLCFIQ